MRRRLILAVGAVVVLVSLPWLWTTGAAWGHVHDAGDAPEADVVIVLGTQVGADRHTPEARLAGRLRTASELVTSGRARAILVSGDGGGESGDETASMTGYLTGELGIDPARVVADPYGLDTYDSCRRARDVYGVRSALIVTQAYHLPRAVTVCRQLDVDVEGVRADCTGCGARLLAGKWVRDYFASGKAAWDVLRGRAPAVTSPATTALTDAAG
ncbi:SanA/YdcF family protein [Symbioplanes lichenis]|uniref:SanA/YdcF family protein n=1 Tax=Symbioplanes lichenis TaxID=1629072 RepID=UPI002739E737|nr:ElyC/SanA/YdcF family protein [Actinoplanes lichenis]